MQSHQTTAGNRPGAAPSALLLLTLMGSVVPGSAAIDPSVPAATEAIPVGREIAVLPLLNRTGGVAPVSELRDALAASLEERGLSVLERGTLDRFMRRHRMRYTGGIDGEMARALRAETGARAVLVTSLDLYQETNPPKAGMISRLVSTGEVPRVLWMDGAERTGDESPGLLDLGLISDSKEVTELVIDRLADSLSRHAAGVGSGDRDRGPRKARRRYRPKVAYSSLHGELDGVAHDSIAVLPFANESTTRHAGEILTDQLVRHLAMAGAPVIEPGVVRQMMLEARQIQPLGPSIPQVDILRAALNVDAIVYGEVAHYQEAAGSTRAPVLGFSLRAIDTESQQVFWSSVSHTKGDDGVFFFDVGEIASAHRLASELSRAIVAAWMAGEAKGVNGAHEGQAEADVEESEEELAMLAGDADRLVRMLEASKRAREELQRQLEAVGRELAEARQERNELDRRLRQSLDLGSGSDSKLSEMAEERQAAARRLTDSERRESILKDSIDDLELLLDEARRHGQGLEAALALGEQESATLGRQLEQAGVRQEELLARIEARDQKELERQLEAVQGELAEARDKRDELESLWRERVALVSGSERLLAEMSEQREQERQHVQELEAALALSEEERAALARQLENAGSREAELLARIEALGRRQEARPIAEELAEPQPEISPALETQRPSAPEQAFHPAEVEAAVRAWADAWSGQRVEGYLARYSRSFEPPRGLDRAAWEAQRRTRLSRPEFIELRLDSLRIEPTAIDSARAGFRQSYRSNTFTDVVDKTLELRREEDGWKIVEERAGD